MVTSVYEGMFLLDSNRFARDAQGVSDQIPEMVKQCGGEVLVSRLWSEQKLAFPIKGHRKGTYWLTYFRMDGQKMDDFRRKCSLNGDILRNLVISVDDRLVDALVKHAEGGGRSTAPPAVTEGGDDKDTSKKTSPAPANDLSDKDSSSVKVSSSDKASTSSETSPTDKTLSGNKASSGDGGAAGEGD